MRQLEQNVSELKLRASELERERDEASESASARRRPYQELERAYQKEVAAHKETNELFIAARLTAFVLFALLIGRRSPVVVCAEVGAWPDDPRQPQPVNCSLRCSGDYSPRGWPSHPVNADHTTAACTGHGTTPRTDRRRFPVLLTAIAALALAMTLLFSPVQAQEGSAPGIEPDQSVSEGDTDLPNDNSTPGRGLLPLYVPGLPGPAEHGTCGPGQGGGGAGRPGQDRIRPASHRGPLRPVGAHGCSWVQPERDGPAGRHQLRPSLPGRGTRLPGCARTRCRPGPGRWPNPKSSTALWGSPSSAWASWASHP